jgi:hypothetical protein
LARHRPRPVLDKMRAWLSLVETITVDLLITPIDESGQALSRWRCSKRGLRQ